MAETLGVVCPPKGGTPHDPFRTAVARGYGFQTWGNIRIFQAPIGIAKKQRNSRLRG